MYHWCRRVGSSPNQGFSQLWSNSELSVNHHKRHLVPVQKRVDQSRAFEENKLLIGPITIQLHPKYDSQVFFQINYVPAESNV